MPDLPYTPSRYRVDCVMMLQASGDPATVYSLSRNGLYGEMSTERTLRLSKIYL
jgi:hypothetical protein